MGAPDLETRVREIWLEARTWPVECRANMAMSLMQSVMVDQGAKVAEVTRGPQVSADAGFYVVSAVGPAAAALRGFVLGLRERGLAFAS